MAKKNKIISFIGYSGHAFVCIDIAILRNFNILGYYDFKEVKNNRYNLDYLGNEENFKMNDSLLFCSVGNNSRREFIFKKIYNEKKNMFVNLIHPSTIISKSSNIFENVLISAGAIVNSFCTIERGAIINTNAVIEHECHIKQFAHLAPGTILAGNVTIGRRSFIGGNSFVKQGVKICDDVIIGAGSTVLKDINKPGTYIGSPAKLLNY